MEQRERLWKFLPYGWVTYFALWVAVPAGIVLRGVYNSELRWQLEWSVGAVVFLLALIFFQRFRYAVWALIVCMVLLVPIVELMQ